MRPPPSSEEHRCLNRHRQGTFSLRQLLMNIITGGWPTLMMLLAMVVDCSVAAAMASVPAAAAAAGDPSGGSASVDYYEYRHVVAAGVQRALVECRERFKWDRWNCPKKAFLDILDRDMSARAPLPSNKELGFTRALIASGIVLSLTRSCSYGANNCGCNTTIPTTTAADRLIIQQQQQQQLQMASSIPSPGGPNNNLNNGNNNNISGSDQSKFVWNGCDESVKFAFRVSKVYLESQDLVPQQGSASRRINAHNYEVGRLAVKRSMKKLCKCHGVSGSCQIQTCWTTVPDMNKVGEYLKRKYRLAAKVGAMTAEETDVGSLNKELASIGTDKMVFVDASPDYCYENPSSGINGTLGRYCSRARQRHDGSEVSRYERDSCDRLCTKCGYRIKREVIKVDRQCHCKFVYCCSVECKSCPAEEEAYKCVRHS